MAKEETLDDDELLSAVADLMEEVQISLEDEEYVNDIEEELDDKGELNEAQRTRMKEILGELRASKAKGALIEDDVEDDLEDDLEDDAELEEPDIDE